MIDDVSDPGSWAREMAKAPWAYGQAQEDKLQKAFVKIRAAGLWEEAAVLQLEIITLKRELECQK